MRLDGRPENRPRTGGGGIMQVAYHASNVNGDAVSTIVQAALAGSGDVAYSWDLVGDSIVWAGDISAMLGLDGCEVVANGDASHDRTNPGDTGRHERKAGGERELSGRVE